MLALKQEESTLLNRDNERLIGELRQESSKVHMQTLAAQSLTTQVQTLTVAEAQAATLAAHHRGEATGLRDELKSLNNDAVQTANREADLRRQIETLTSRLELLAAQEAAGSSAVEASPTVKGVATQKERGRGRRTRKD